MIQYEATKAQLDSQFPQEAGRIAHWEKHLLPCKVCLMIQIVVNQGKWCCPESTWGLVQLKY